MFSNVIIWNYECFSRTVINWVTIAVWTIVQAGITVWAVVQAVLTATFNSYRDRQISTPYNINPPEPIDKKFGTVDYVREGTPYTKFDTNPPTEGFWANWWKITKIFLFIYFSQARVQVRPVDGFLHAIAQKTWNHARMCLFGVIKLKFNFKPLFMIISKTVKFWPKTGLKFFSPENA